MNRFVRHSLLFFLLIALSCGMAAEAGAATGGGGGGAGGGARPSSAARPQIACGDYHTYVIKSVLDQNADGGSLYAWGYNGFGQLGDCTIVDKHIPTRIGLASGWAAVACGAHHMLALGSNGSLYACGFNGFGQLGDGTLVDKPLRIRIGTANDWVAVACGGNHTVALKGDGSLWAWGSNGYGQLGDGTTVNKTTPTRIGAANDWVSVACGSSHTVALKSDGSLHAWGYNRYGRLGDGTTTDRHAPTRIGTSNDWVSVACGSSHTLALKSDGSLYAWGYNFYGQLGDGTTVDKSSPTRIGTANDWVAAAGGFAHTVALKSDGSLHAWGYNEFGQVGDGTTDARSDPVQVMMVGVRPAVAGGYYHTVALKSDGSLYAWGDNWSGQLGDGTAWNERHAPIRIDPLEDWVAAAGGYGHTAALRSDGSLYAWGSNGNGQLGDGTTIDKPVPTRVGTANDWAAVACGYWHTVALKSDGSLYAWGYNAYGQLGDGTTIDNPTPTRVGTANDWVAVTCGREYTVALKSDGSLYAWGYNGHGQLGVGTTVDERTPTRVGMTNDWVAVACGNSHTVALKSDGSLYAWGSNYHGQLGDGTLDNKSSPTRIGAANVWAAVACGDGYTVALKSDGSLNAWGYNATGQLGDGTIVDKHIPTRIGIVSDWAAVACGGAHTIATRSDGSLYAWGSSVYGQLGDGTTDDKTTPTPILSLSDMQGPTIDTLTSSTHPDQGLSYADDSPALAWTASDSSGVAGYSYVLDQTSDTVPDTTSEGSGTSTSYTGIADGVWHFHLRAVDTLENWSATSHYTIRIDTAAPTTEARETVSDVLLTSGQWWPGSVGVRLIGSDPDGSVASISYVLDGGETVTATGSGTSWSTTLLITGEADHTLEYWSVDAAGNEELPHKTVTVRIDDTPPTVGIQYLEGTPGLSGWYVSPVRVHLTGNDTRSGLASLWWSLSGPGSWTPYNSGSPPQVEWQGTRPFYYRALDNVGNERWDSQSLKIDTHNPITSCTVEGVLSAWGWYHTDVNVRLSPTDDGSGVDTLRERVDHSGPDPGWTPYPHPSGSVSVPVTGEGVHTVEFYSTDVAGREESVQSREVKIDKTAPATTTDRPDSFFDVWHNGDVTVALSATDGGGGGGGGAGVAATQGRIDGGGWTDELEIAVPAPPDGSNDGVHGVEYRALDKADNVEPEHTCTVKIDTTAPVTSDDAPAEAREEDVTVTLTARDDPPRGREGQLTSGVAGTEYRLDGGGWTDGGEIVVPAPPDGSNDGEHVIEYRSTDTVGNVEPEHTCRVLIDTTTAEARPWRAQSSGVTDTMRGLAVVYEEEAWAVGLNGRVLYTTDGGETWEPRSTGTTQSFFDVAVNDGPLEDCDAAGTWIVGARGVLLRSTDAGASWQSRSYTTWNLNAVELVGPDIVWVAGAGGQLARSTDGGATWMSMNTRTNEALFDVSFFDEERGWACGYAGTILATTDGGLTWARQESGTVQMLRSLSFFDGMTGCAVGANGTILRTTDGGASWSKVPVTGSGLFSVHACGGGAGSGADGWACGAGGLVLRTSDTGAHWVQEPSGVTDTLYAVDFSDDPVGWAVGAAGRVLYRDACAPLTTAIAPSGWQTSDVHVLLNPTDVGSGVVGTRFNVDGGSWSDGCTVAIFAWPDGSNDGVHTVNYRSTDAAGNTEALRSCEVRIDATAPAPTDNATAAWYRSSFALRLGGDDGAGSGVAEVRYRIDGGAWQMVTAAEAELLLRTWRRGGYSGVHTIDYEVTDGAGHVASGTCTVKLDGKPPRTSDDAPSAVQTGPVTVLLTATDAHSGVAETWYSLDGDTWSPYDPDGIDVPAADGVHTIDYYSIDNVGRVEVLRSCSVTVDVP